MQIVRKQGAGQSVSAPGALLTVKEAAQRMSRSERAVYDMIAKGEIPSFKHGKSRRISEAALANWVEAHCGE